MFPYRVRIHLVAGTINVNNRYQKYLDNVRQCLVALVESYCSFYFQLCVLVYILLEFITEEVMIYLHRVTRTVKDSEMQTDLSYSPLHEEYVTVNLDRDSSPEMPELESDSDNESGISAN
jgi:hypothetical protein